RGLHVLWTKLHRTFCARGRLRRQDTARGQAQRYTSRAADEVRACCQFDYRAGARARSASDAARPRRRGDRVRRREFITLIGAAAAWPFAAHAQQPAMPVIGFMSARSPEVSAHLGAAFRKGLNETGAIEGQNVTVEYHWLEGQYDRLPSLMADLVRR